MSKQNAREMPARAKRRRASKYEPHNGKAECARRVRQIEAGRIPDDQRLKGWPAPVAKG